MLPSSPLFTLLHTTSAQPLAVLSPEQFGRTLFHPSWRSISETAPLLQKYTVLPSYSKPHTQLVLWNARQSPTPTTTFSVCFVSPASVSACLSSHVPCHCATHASETSNLSKTRKLEVDRRHAIDRYNRITLELSKIEAALEISRRWTPLDAEYKDATKFISERRYRAALEKLQKLVIQRLFELEKLNIAHTGTSPALTSY